MGVMRASTRIMYVCEWLEPVRLISEHVNTYVCAPFAEATIDTIFIKL